MKLRWMKSVIDTSGQTAPALPFQRGARRGAGCLPLTAARLRTA